MKNNSPKISIIVPMHNSSKFIVECIESILAQNFSDYELLLIDDYSNDNTIRICQKYLEDKRIHIYSNNEKKGVSSARNIGINNAKGKYMAFIDSDDIVSKKYLEILYTISESNPNWLVMCGYTRFDEGNPFFAEDTLLDKHFVFSDIMLANIFYFHPSAWGCLFRSETIKNNNILMERNASFNEDIYFTCKCLCLCDGALCINNGLYGYRTNPSGIGANKNHLELTINDVEHRARGYYAFKDALEFAKTKSLGKDKYIDIGYSFIAAEVLLTAARAGTKNFSLKSCIKRYVSPWRCIRFCIHGKNMLQKLLVIGIAINPSIVKFILDDKNILRIALK